jgi:hypothetical protein
MDDILEVVDELPHLSGGNPACALGGCISFAISRSFPYDLACVDRYSRLEVFN